MKLKIKCLIFDLGNVIFKCSLGNVYSFWSKIINEQPQIIKNKINFGLKHDLFEKGKISPNEFYCYINEQLNNKLSYPEFINGWNSIFEDMIPGIENLIKKLKNNFKIIGLTNTNEIHYNFWNNKYKKVLKLFDKIYSSHLLGMRKPDKEIFNYILKENNIKKDEVVFFDDSMVNIEGTNLNGITSCLVISFDKMKRDIESYGIEC